jgi:hypothetical protein
MWGIGAKRGTASVPTEVMEFIAGRGHFHLAHYLTVTGGARSYIYDSHRIRTAVLIGIEGCNIGQVFWRRAHG